MTSNAYPELPSVPYAPTTVAMLDVIAYLQARPRAIEIKRAAYIIFRNESANGERGINNNYVGVQADGSRWPGKWDAVFTGTVAVQENGTGRERIFLAFDHWSASVDFLLDRIETRGLYIGGATREIVKMMVATETDLARAYHKEWVTGSATSEPSAQEIADFRSMYSQSTALFRGAAPAPLPHPTHPAPAGGFQDDPAAETETDALNDRVLAGEQFTPTQE